MFKIDFVLKSILLRSGTSNVVGSSHLIHYFFDLLYVLQHLHVTTLNQMTKTKRKIHNDSALKHSSYSDREYLKVVKIVLISILTIILMCVLIFSIAIFSNYLKTEGFKRKLGDGASSARMVQAPINENAYESKISLLKSSGVADMTSPVLSERLDTCLLAGIVRGWVYTDWQQKCYQSYYDLIPTKYSKDDVITKLAATPMVAEQFGEIDLSASNEDCGIYTSSYVTSLRYFSSNEKTGSCMTPEHIFIGDTGSIVEDYHGKTLVIKSFQKDDVDRRKAYIQIEGRADYYESFKLGCGGIMCSSPIKDAVPAFK